MEASEMLARVDATVEQFKNDLLLVGSTQRLNKAQREALSKAYSPILSLPAVLRDITTRENRGTMKR